VHRKFSSSKGSRADRNGSVVCGPSSTGVVDSNPTRGMDLCPRIFVLYCPAQIDTSRWGAPPLPSKESCHMSRRGSKIRQKHSTARPKLRVDYNAYIHTHTHTRARAHAHKMKWKPSYVTVPSISWRNETPYVHCCRDTYLFQLLKGYV
jgi:hypothetical protein